MRWGSVWRVMEGRERFGWWFCWDSIPKVVVVVLGSSMAGLGEVLVRREVMYLYYALDFWGADEEEYL